MYYASTHTRRPKQKIGVSVVTTDGEVFEAHVFVTSVQRIKDMLNDDNQFVAFETLGGATRILNRNAIECVVLRQSNVEAIDIPEQAKVA